MDKSSQIQPKNYPKIRHHVTSSINNNFQYKKLGHYLKHTFLNQLPGGQTEFAAGTGMGQGEGLRDVTDEIEVRSGG